MNFPHHNAATLATKVSTLSEEKHTPRPLCYPQDDQNNANETKSKSTRELGADLVVGSQFAAHAVVRARRIMSAHPNAILLLTLTPEGLARKTMAAILAETNTESDDDVKIGGEEYHHEIMESDYNDSWQISAKEGDLLFFDLVTYDYGEQVPWEKLEAQKRELEEWAKGICERHHCSYKISVTANYW